MTDYAKPLLDNFPTFLGLCHGVLVRGDGLQLDLFRVGKLHGFPFFPQNLGDFFVLLAFRDLPALAGHSMRIELRTQNVPINSAWANFNLLDVPSANWASVAGVRRPYSATREPDQDQNGQVSLPLLVNDGWCLYPLPCPPLQVPEPGEIEVVFDLDQTKKKIGSFDLRFVRPTPFTDEERRALMGRADALSGVCMDVSCKQCREVGRFYLRLNPFAEIAPPEWGLSLDEAPDSWSCKCGKAKQTLLYMKQGLHDLFRRVHIRTKRHGFTSVPLYEAGMLDSLHHDYMTAIREHRDNEEAIQKVLQDNSVMWNFLAPTRIWHKPTILTDCRADFGILTATKTLYLIEIEKPSTRLSRGRSGGTHSELTRGLDQLRAWRRVIEKHRGAFLDALRIRDDDVHAIKYMLIAGLACETPNSELELLRAERYPADLLYCFDDLAAFLKATSLSLQNL